jgi:hypothetical protein
MGYRIFRDSQGTEWQTWDVVPRVGERRMSERRSRVPVPVAVNRRTSRDRRMVTGPRPLLRSGMDAGWLCFEATHEKRRLAPIPTDWQRCPVRKLQEYCAQAKPARRISLEVPSIPRTL